MLNQVILVGKIIKEIKKDSKVITIGITRNYRNPETLEHDVDNLDIRLSDSIHEQVFRMCGKGAVIGVKAHLEQVSTNINGIEFKKALIIAEKVTFINAKGKE